MTDKRWYYAILITLLLFSFWGYQALEIGEVFRKSFTVLLHYRICRFIVIGIGFTEIELT